MENLSYWRLISEIERRIKDCVPGSHPRNWDVTFITEALARSFQTGLQGVMVTGFRSNFTITWSAYRQKGKPEAATSDLSLLVRIGRKDGTSHEGAAFIETKVKQDHKRTFDSFKLPELKKLFRSSPFSQVLFFDYEDITSYSSNRSVLFPALEYSPWRGGIPVTPCTYAVVVPANTVVSRHVNDTSIYDFSVPFSYQLIYRYFHGFDLDLTEQAVQAAKGQPTRKGFSRYLLCLTLEEEGAESAPEVDLNRKTWGPIE
jgi:hypothetical protein